MFNCPACGAQTPDNLDFTKLMVCEHCSNILFIEDEAVKNAGLRSAQVDAPSIFTLGRHYRYRNMNFETIGRLQFDYGDGLWEEWWVMTDAGDGKWISVDEGDIAIESALENIKDLPGCKYLKPGEKINLLKQNLLVTEVDSAECIAVSGQLPERIMPGEKHDYVHLSGKHNILYTLECFEGQKKLYKGVWIDAFDIEPL